MTRDANQIAEDWARTEARQAALRRDLEARANEREAERDRDPERNIIRASAPTRGTFSMWRHGLLENEPDYQSSDVLVSVKDGVIITTDKQGDLEFFVPLPGSYSCLVRNRAGE